MSPEELKTVEQLVEKFINDVTEFSDSVRVFITAYDPNGGGTRKFSNGNGNFYAQIGQIKEWVVKQDQHVKNEAIKLDSDT